jgi:molybdopterin molybdotransferase
MLLGLFDRPGIAAADLGLVPDDDQSLANALQGALRDGADLVVSTGGASGSEADRLLPALGSIGASAEKLRIAQRPGKPMVIGRMGTVPIVGLPGNPLAALVGAVFFVLPLLDALAGLPARRAVGRIVRLADGFARKPARTEWLPARLEEAVDGTTTAHPLTPFGSARLRLLAEAEGLVEIPPGDAAPRWHAPWSCCR